MTSQQFSKELEHIARPLVEAGIYPSEEAFVRDVIKDMALRKIKAHEERVDKYRSRYGSLENLGARIKGTASPKQEDVWLEWEAASDMLKAWKKVVKSSV